MKRYVIERNIPGAGMMTEAELAEAARVSCHALDRVGDGIAWEHSYVAGDKTYCIYRASGPDAIREHARLSGFPADSITELRTVLTPDHASA